MILLDTSLWIEALRENGDPACKRLVEDSLASGRACWMSMIRLELWNGARGESEKRALREFEEVLTDLEVVPKVWETAFDLARRAGKAGLTVPAANLLIVACARHHRVEVESTDSHFAELKKL
ncbi:MAG TPA: PIN domain-containing protein [Opitutaceae bacterium]